MYWHWLLRHFEGRVIPGLFLFQPFSRGNFGEQFRSRSIPALMRGENAIGQLVSTIWNARRRRCGIIERLVQTSIIWRRARGGSARSLVKRKARTKQPKTSLCKYWRLRNKPVALSHWQPTGWTDCTNWTGNSEPFEEKVQSRNAFDHALIVYFWRASCPKTGSHFRDAI